jgi:predicted negative regulator of RcsB-dependent stress response
VDFEGCGVELYFLLFQKAYLLLGTKEEWQMYKPNLHMSLHIEELMPQLVSKYSVQPTMELTKKEVEKKDVAKKSTQRLSLKPSIDEIIDATAKLKIVPDKTVLYTIGRNCGIVI